MRCKVQVSILNLLREMLLLYNDFILRLAEKELMIVQIYKGFNFALLLRNLLRMWDEKFKFRFWIWLMLVIVIREVELAQHLRPLCDNDFILELAGEGLAEMEISGEFEQRFHQMENWCVVKVHVSILGAGHLNFLSLRKIGFSFYWFNFLPWIYYWWVVANVVWIY